MVGFCRVEVAGVPPGKRQSQEVARRLWLVKIIDPPGHTWVIFAEKLATGELNAQLLLVSAVMGPIPQPKAVVLRPITHTPPATSFAGKSVLFVTEGATEACIVAG